MRRHDKEEVFDILIKQPPSDTTPSADAHQAALLGTLTTAQRIGKALDLSDFTIRLSRRAIRRANPGMSEADVKIAFVDLHYGRDLADRVRSRLAR